MVCICSIYRYDWGKVEVKSEDDDEQQSVAA